MKKTLTVLVSLALFFGGLQVAAVEVVNTGSEPSLSPSNSSTSLRFSLDKAPDRLEDESKDSGYFIGKIKPASKQAKKLLNINAPKGKVYIPFTKDEDGNVEIGNSFAISAELKDPDNLKFAGELPYVVKFPKKIRKKYGINNFKQNFTVTKDSSDDSDSDDSSSDSTSSLTLSGLVTLPSQSGKSLGTSSKGKKKKGKGKKKLTTFDLESAKVELHEVDQDGVILEDIIAEAPIDSEGKFELPDIPPNTELGTEAVIKVTGLPNAEEMTAFAYQNEGLPIDKNSTFFTDKLLEDFEEGTVDPDNVSSLEVEDAIEKLKEINIIPEEGEDTVAEAKEHLEEKVGGLAENMINVVSDPEEDLEGFEFDEDFDIKDFDPSSDIFKEDDSFKTEHGKAADGIAGRYFVTLYSGIVGNNIHSAVAEMGKALLKPPSLSGVIDFIPFMDLRSEAMLITNKHKGVDEFNCDPATDPNCEQKEHTECKDGEECHDDKEHTECKDGEECHDDKEHTECKDGEECHDDKEHTECKEGEECHDDEHHTDCPEGEKCEEHPPECPEGEKCEEHHDGGDHYDSCFILEAVTDREDHKGKGKHEIEDDTEDHDGDGEEEGFFMTVDTNNVITVVAPEFEEENVGPDGTETYKSTSSVTDFLPVGDGMYIGTHVRTGASFTESGATNFLEHQAGYAVLVKNHQTSLDKLQGSFGVVGLSALFERGGNISLRGNRGELQISTDSSVSVSITEDIVERQVTESDDGTCTFSVSTSTETGIEGQEKILLHEESGKIFILKDDEFDKEIEKVRSTFEGYVRPDNNVITFLSFSDVGVDGVRIEPHHDSRRFAGVEAADRDLYFAVRLSDSAPNISGIPYEMISYEVKLDDSGNKTVTVPVSGKRNILTISGSSATISGGEKHLVTSNAQDTINNTVESDSGDSGSASLGANGSLTLTMGSATYYGYVAPDASAIILVSKTDESIAVHFCVKDILLQKED